MRVGDPCLGAKFEVVRTLSTGFTAAVTLVVWQPPVGKERVVEKVKVVHVTPGEKMPQRGDKLKVLWKDSTGDASHWHDATVREVLVQSKDGATWHLLEYDGRVGAILSPRAVRTQNALESDG